MSGACPTCGSAFRGIHHPVNVGGSMKMVQCGDRWHEDAAPAPDAMAEVERLLEVFEDAVRFGHPKCCCPDEDQRACYSRHLLIARTALLDFVRPFVSEPDYEAARVTLDAIVRDLFGADPDEVCAPSWPEMSMAHAKAIVDASRGRGDDEPLSLSR